MSMVQLLPDYSPNLMQDSFWSERPLRVYAHASGSVRLYRGTAGFWAKC